MSVLFFSRYLIFFYCLFKLFHVTFWLVIKSVVNLTIHHRSEPKYRSTSFFPCRNHLFTKNRLNFCPPPFLFFNIVNVEILFKVPLLLLIGGLWNVSPDRYSQTSSSWPWGGPVCLWILCLSVHWWCTTEVPNHIHLA